jgi:putative membrane protein
VVPEDVAAGLVERIATSGVAAVLVVVSLFLAVSIVISIVGTVLVYWDFTLRRDGTRIVITRGLLERRRAAIPLARLQALRVHANPVRRLLGLASVSAVVAGYTQQRDEQRQTNMVLPIARREAAFRIAGELLDASPGLEGLARERLPVRALAQRLTYALVVGLGLGAAGLIAFGAPGAAAIGAVPLLGAWAWGAWRAAGYGVSGAHVVVRGGALFRRHFIVPIANVQHVELRASPLQNAFGVATLRLRIPKAAPAVPGLLRGRAEESFGALSSKLPA